MAAVNHTLTYAFFVLFGDFFFFLKLFHSCSSIKQHVDVLCACRSGWAVLSPHNCWVTYNYARMCNPDSCGSLSQLCVHRGFNLMWLLIHLRAVVPSYQLVMHRYFGAKSLGLLPEENAPKKGSFIYSLQEREENLALRLLLKWYQTLIP